MWILPLVDVHTCPYLVQSNENDGVSQFWRALGSQLVSSVVMSEGFKFTQFIVFLFARSLFGEFFDDFRQCNVSPSEGKCLRRSVNSSTPALSI